MSKLLWVHLAQSPHEHSNCPPRTGHLDRGAVAPAERSRPTLHLVPDSRQIRPDLRSQRLQAGAATARRWRCGGQHAAVVAVRAQSVLRVGVLRLRVQQDHHRAPFTRGSLPRPVAARDGAARCRTRPWRSAVAVAPGWRVPHASGRQRTHPMDGHAAAELPAAACRRGVHRGRPAHGQQAASGPSGQPGLQPHQFRHPGLRPEG